MPLLPPAAPCLFPVPAAQWVVMLSEEAESTPEHWRDAFDTLIANATSGP
jgi:hypothetical protein